MLFSSLTFVWFFLPALALIYYLMPGRKLKNAILLIASLIFYTWGEPRYVVLVLLSILVNYVFGLVIAGLDRGPGVKASDEKGPGEMKQDRKRLGRKKLALAVCVIANICLLGYFKYFNFFLELVYTIAGKDGFTPRNIPLPIGISFYTFQAISCIADIYRGVKPVQKNMFRLALYISLFPQILSGPIVRYNELEPQITGRRESISMHAYGIKRFVCGLAKKMIFANMFGQVVDRIWELPLEQLGTAMVWFTVILYSFQIYYDFSGYSDMAIGLGRMFGFTYQENFNFPYLSASVSEFWRRWHISLSTWFKQYLYIPLGGNRKGLNRTCVNLFVVFLATGLWHGASMNFICWGIYYGIFIVAERLWIGTLLDKNPYKVLNHVYALVVVAFGWLLFRVQNLHQAKVMVTAMLVPKAGLWNLRIFMDNRIIFLLILAVCFCGPVQQLFPGLKKRLFDEERMGVLDVAVMAFLLLLCTMLMVSSTYQAFIYFRF